MSLLGRRDRPRSKNVGKVEIMTSNTMVKRFGVAGLIFFTVKGLLWLVVPGMLVYFGS